MYFRPSLRLHYRNTSALTVTVVEGAISRNRWDPVHDGAGWWWGQPVVGRCKARGGRAGFVTPSTSSPPVVADWKVRAPSFFQIHRETACSAFSRLFIARKIVPANISRTLKSNSHHKMNVFHVPPFRGTWLSLPQCIELEIRKQFRHIHVQSGWFVICQILDLETQRWPFEYRVHVDWFLFDGRRRWRFRPEIPQTVKQVTNTWWYKYIPCTSYALQYCIHSNGDKLDLKRSLANTQWWANSWEFILEKILNLFDIGIKKSIAEVGKPVFSRSNKLK